MSLRQEFRETARLAVPLVLGEIGWMLMAIVDTMMVGRLPNGAEAMGAVGMGSVIFYAVAIFGTGLLLGLDTLVSHAFGAGVIADCHRSLWSGLYLCLLAAPLLMGVQWVVAQSLAGAGVNPAVLRETIPFLQALSWGTLPLLCFQAIRRYLQGMSLAAPVMFALFSANVVNAFADWVLIFGKLGFPALGATGAGWATCTARVYLSLVLALFAVYHDRVEHTGLWKTFAPPDWRRIAGLVKLGLPAGLMFLFEVSLFAVSAVLIGKLDPVSLAGHQVAMNTVSMTYMVPLGVSSAAAVRVGQALGRRDPAAARRAGWAAIALGAGFMTAAAVVLLVIPEGIARLFTPKRPVIEMAATLLVIAAFFQLFDGLQTVATGALRGAGDTRTPMLTHLICYWAIGLPAGWWLCFHSNLGAAGIWMGFSLALILIGIVLLIAWQRRSRRFLGQA